MSEFTITWTATLPEGTTHVLVPTGLPTPEATPGPVRITGGQYTTITETNTGQSVLLVTPDTPEMTVTWSFAPTPGAYPDRLFNVHPSRHTRAARALIDEATAIGADLPPAERAIAIARATADRFTYGHPTERFTDGHTEIPALGCDVTVGSCVDINTYFLAALRAVGIEAAYVTGFFFPAEKQGACEDGHCWVLTRIDDKVAAWDIAHHLKMGTREILPALNPKPGFRAACFSGMGLTFPELGLTDYKALIEPLCLNGPTPLRPDAPTIRLNGISMEAVA